MGWVTLSRNWTTSAGLSTTGKVRGFFGAGITASIRHGLFERDRVEKPERRHREADGAGGQLPVGGQVDRR